MVKRTIPLWFLGLGILIGVGLFSLSYWWVGTITLSATIGIITGGGIILVKQFQIQPKQEEEQK